MGGDGCDDYSQRYGRVREWGISAKVTAKPTEPCLQVLNGLVTIVNSPPPAPIAVPTNPSPDDHPGLQSSFKLYISKIKV